MSATAQDRRVFAAFVRQLDLDNSGTVSYEELAYALRTKDVVIVGGDGTTPSANVPQPRQGTASEWYLEHISLNGHSYLVDRHTMRVYNPATGDEQWPQLVGKLHGSRLVPYENSREQRASSSASTTTSSLSIRASRMSSTLSIVISVELWTRWR